MNQPPQPSQSETAAAASQTLRDAVTAAARLLPPGCRVCVALSGGRDSVVLLHVLAQHASFLGFSLQACHIHHNLQPAAAAWPDFCAQLCEKWGIPFEFQHVQVPPHTRQGAEQAARQVRYAALDAVDADVLALAHHQDDQAETLLFRLARGTGITGAAAMRQWSPHTPPQKPRWRPLLEIPRSVITQYAQAYSLNWVEDPSNTHTRYTRNQLRQTVFPSLSALFPAAVSNLARAAQLFGQAQTLLSDLAELDFAACAGTWQANQGIARWAYMPMQKLTEPRALNLLHHLILKQGGYAPGQVRLKEAWRQLLQGQGAGLYLPLSDTHVLAAYRDWIWLRPPFSEIPSITQQALSDSPIPWQGATLTLQPTPGSGIAKKSLDTPNAYWGTRQPGLRVQQHPSQTPQRFKEACQTHGIPPWLRSILPILYLDHQPAWIAGMGVLWPFSCPENMPGVTPFWEGWPPAAPYAGKTPVER